MVLKFYNTLTRSKDEFVPLHAGEVKMYSCGPTVYDYPHIGNLRAFVFDDLLRRYLKYRGFKLTHVMNLTDVDDKTIRNSKKEGMTLAEFTEKYAKVFFESLETMHVEKVEHYPRATEHIKEMVELVKILLDKGVAYKGTDGSVYFNIRKFPDYGKLSKLDVSALKPGARVCQDEYAKDEARDFALWKAWTEDDGDVFWETEIGKGRPGWHIECSVMSSKYLGRTFDIHTGGVDLMFPHHENEIAQSEAAYGKQFVNYWLHNDHVMVDGQKMSKSLGNYLTLKDLLARGHDQRAIRYVLLSTHYRSKLNVTDESLWAAKQTVERFDNFIDLLREVKATSHHDVDKLVHDVEHKFMEAMDDDLDVNTALATLFDFMKEINKLIDAGKIGKAGAEKCIHVMQRFDKILGVLKKETSVPKELVEKALNLLVEFHETLKTKDAETAKRLDKDVAHLKGKEYDPENFSELMAVFVDVREALRKKKEYALSDKIRADLKDAGITLEDKEGGVRWRIA
ncbi:MAG: cysteine--tRNA ligase [Candidatus Aenigmatarchaeota archaeon]